MFFAVASILVAISVWQSAIELDKPAKMSKANLKELEAQLDAENERLDQEIKELLLDHRRLCNGKKSI